MSTAPPRPTWTTATIRAVDLRDDDTVLINGMWREVFDVWKDGDDPASQLGEGETLTVAILAKTDWSSPCWVAVRYVDEDRSTANEVASALYFLRLRELVQVQVQEAGKSDGARLVVSA